MFQQQQLFKPHIPIHGLLDDAIDDCINYYLLSSFCSSIQVFDFTENTTLVMPSKQSNVTANKSRSRRFHLVPCDMISFKIGDIVPADSANVSSDQATLTRESLPQNKKVSDECFS
jgi:magnesium-transporting ATPase (P-type)